MGRKKGTVKNRTVEESEVLRWYINFQVSKTERPIVSEIVVSEITGISKSSLREFRMRKTISEEHEKQLETFRGAMKELINYSK